MNAFTFIIRYVKIKCTQECIHWKMNVFAPNPAYQLSRS